MSQLPIEVKKAPVPDTSAGEPLSISELGAVLIKHFGFHEGLYDVMVEFQIGTGSQGSADSGSNITPGLVVSISRIGLNKATKVSNGLTLDASIVNPVG